MRRYRNFCHGFWESRPKLTENTQLIFKRDEEENYNFQGVFMCVWGPTFSKDGVHLLIPKETYSIELVTFSRGGL